MSATHGDSEQAEGVNGWVDDVSAGEPFIFVAILAQQADVKAKH